IHAGASAPVPYAKGTSTYSSANSVLVSPTSDKVAGTAWSLTLTLKDSNDSVWTNEETVYYGFDSNDPSLVASYDSSTHVYTMAAPAAVYQTAQDYVAKVAVNTASTPFLESDTITVVAGAASASGSLLVAPTSSVSGTDDYTITVTIRDEYQNVITTGKTVKFVFTVDGADVQVWTALDRDTYVYSLYMFASVGQVIGTHPYSITFNGSTLLTGNSLTVVAPVFGDNCVVTYPLTGQVAGVPFDVTLTLKDEQNQVHTDPVTIYTYVDKAYALVPFDSTTNTYTVTSPASWTTAATNYEIIFMRTQSGFNTIAKTGQMSVIHAAPDADHCYYSLAERSAESRDRPTVPGQEWSVSVDLYDAYDNEVNTPVDVDITFAMGTTVVTTAMISRAVSTTTSGDQYEYVKAAPYPGVGDISGTWDISITVDGTPDFFGGTEYVIIGTVPSATECTLVAPTVDIPAGDGFTMTLTLRDENGDPITLIGYSVEAVFNVGNSQQYLNGVYDSVSDTYTITSDSSVDEVVGTHSYTIEWNYVELKTGSVTITTGALSDTGSTYVAPTTNRTAGTNWGVSFTPSDAYSNPVSVTSVEAVYTLDSDTHTETLVQNTSTPTKYDAYAPTAVTNKAGVWAVSITVDGQEDFLSGKSVTVVAAAPSAPDTVLVAPTSDVTAGAGFTLSITIRDEYQNVVSTGSAVQAVFSVDGSDVTLTAVYASTTSVYTVTSTAAIDEVAGTHSYTVTYDGSDYVTGNSVTVVAGEMDSTTSTFTVPNADVVAGTPVSVSAILRDEYGNTLLTDLSLRARFSYTRTSGGSSRTDVAMSFDSSTHTYTAAALEQTYTAVHEYSVSVLSSSSQVLLQDSVTVVPASASTSESTLTVPDADLMADTPFSVSLALADEYTNTITAEQTVSMVFIGKASPVTVTPSYDSSTYVYTAAAPASVYETAAAYTVLCTVEGVAPFLSDSVTIVSHTPDAPSSTLTVPDGDLEACDACSVSLVLADENSNTLFVEKVVSMVFTGLASPVSVTPTFDSSSLVYTAAAPTSLCQTAGSYTVSCTVEGVPSFLSDTITVVAGEADASTTTFTVPTSDVVAGTPFSMGATLRDEYGNTLLSDVSLKVRVYYADPSGGGQRTDIPMTFDPSTHTYSCAAIATTSNTARTSALMLIQLSPSFTKIMEDSLTVVPASPDATESWLTVPSADLVAGTPFSVTLDLEDKYSNTITAEQTVSIVFTGGASPVSVTPTYDSASYVYTAAAPAAVYEYAAEHTVSCTVNGVTSFISRGVTVLPGDADASTSTFTVPTDDVVAGTAFTLNAVLRDEYSNMLTSDQSMAVVFTGPSSSGGSTTYPSNMRFDYSADTYFVTAPTDVYRYAADYTVTLADQGTYTQFIDGGSFTVVPASPHAPSSTFTVHDTNQVAGTFMSISLTLADEYTNTIFAEQSVSFVVAGGPSPVTLSPTYDPSQGVYFTVAPASVYETAAEYTISCTVNGETSFLSEDVTVSPGDADASTSTFTVPNGDVVAGTPFSFTAVIRDEYGNTLWTDQELSVRLEWSTEFGSSAYGDAMVFDSTTMVHTFTAPQSVYDYVALSTVMLSTAAPPYIRPVTFMQGYSVNVVPAPPHSPSSTLTVPQGDLDAGTAFAVTLALVDEYTNTITAEQSVAIVFTGGASPVSVTPTYDSATSVYTAAAPASVTETAAAYTVSCTVEGVAPFLSDSVTVVAAAADPVASPVTTTTTTRRRRGRTSSFTVAVTDSYGNSASSATASSSSKAVSPHIVALSAQGDGWSVSETATYNPSTSLYTVSLLWPGSGEATLVLTVDGVAAEKQVVDIGVSVAFMIVAPLLCLALVGTGVAVWVYWPRIMHMLHGDTKMEESKEDVTLPSVSEGVVVEAVPVAVSMPVTQGVVLMPMPIPVAPTTSSAPLMPIDPYPVSPDHVSVDVPHIQPVEASQSHPNSESDTDLTHSDDISISDPSGDMV
ncbi:hypothetical protein KIPB_007653, partial [Kipferlia bialata]